MNALGMWIKENTTRREFAKLIGVSVQSIARMCGKYGVSEKHIDAVSAATKIPRAQLCGIEGKGNARSSAPKFDGAYWTDMVEKMTGVSLRPAECTVTRNTEEMMSEVIRHASTEQLRREWDLWASCNDEELDGVEFDYEQIHAELNRRGEGRHCAV